MKRIVPFLLSLIMLLSLCACGGKPVEGDQDVQGERQIKENLTVTLSVEPTTLNPHAVGQLNAYIVNYCIYDTLLKKDADGNIVPNVAKEYEPIDDTHIRFHLRDDVMFSNGEKLTAEDVLYTIKCITEGSTTKSTYSAFDGENSYIEDEYTVVIALKKPFAAVYDFLTHSYSSIVCKSYYEAVGKDEYGINPVGSGPYTLGDWTSGSSIVLKRNDNYWGEKAASAMITLKFISEQSNRAMELETGGTDIALAISTMDASRIDSSDELELIKVPSYQVVFLGLNQTKDLTSDLRVRKALAYATDAATIENVVYGEFGSVADSPVAQGVPEYSSCTTYEYNIEKAKELLAEAGYPDGITLTGRVQNNADFEAISAMIPNMWEKAGINIEINVYDKATYSEKGKENGGTNITVSAQTATTGNAYQAIGTLFSTTSTSGVVNNRDEMVDSLISEAAKEYDFSARKEKYAKAEQYIIDNVLIIPIAFTSQIYGVSKNVVDFDASPANIPILTYTYAYEN